MKRIFLAFVAIMFVANAFAQNNNLFWTMRVEVKMDKKLEWEKKVPVFLKTHYPQMNFRAFEVMTGPNSGSYFFSMGPMSYKDLDVPPVFPKGEAAVKNDGQALDALSESFEVTHYKRVDAISNIKADRKIQYTQVNFVEINIGSWRDVEAILTKVRDVRVKNDLKMDVSYFRPVNSGAGNRFTSVRYIEKMEELDMEGAQFAEMYDKVHGDNAWYKDWQNYVSMVKSTHTELWVLRTDLSTPKPTSVSAN